MKQIKVENLSHKFIHKDSSELLALANINLEITAGNFVVVLGESGCGKTTLLNIMAGLLKPSEGKVLIDDKKVVEPHYSRSIISQQSCLLPWLNVKDNIAFGCKLRGEHKDLHARVENYIKLIGLEGFEKVFPGKLSIGMAQRVSIARSLIGHPEILLLDEPFTSLDFYNRNRLQTKLIKIWQRFKFTAVFVTHDIDESILLGKKIVILSKRPGQIKHIFELDDEYPRDLESKKLSAMKSKIQKIFKDLAYEF